MTTFEVSGLSLSREKGALTVLSTQGRLWGKRQGLPSRLESSSGHRWGPKPRQGSWGGWQRPGNGRTFTVSRG